jgi:ABC-type antimicrobial peptide transport system permease subunit
MSLGAARRDVVRLIVGEGAGIAIAGVALGVAAALALTRVMATLLVGVSPRDPVTLIGGAALLLAVAIVASYIPALRASRIEPMAALRE